ncbi:MAG: energy transducer TonB [Verrucomicrobiota bacterium]|nr:energy transducer TonB [Verrucomicrobiota bacterium]
MQTGKSIINLPLLVGAILSVAIHVMALYGKGPYTPAAPLVKTGKTVVHLTLIPTAASQAKPFESMEPMPEKSIPEPVPTPEPVIAPAPEPEPQPVAETAKADSQEQDASLIEEKGVVSEAQATSPITPAYPRISRHRGEKGTVSLSVQILASGKAGQIEVLQSSGHKRLDEAARRAVRETPFTPATQFGRNIDSETELSFTFRLTDD